LYYFATTQLSSDVARLPCAQGQKIFLRHHQRKTAQFEVENKHEAQQKQSKNICCVVTFDIFRSNKQWLP